MANNKSLIHVVSLLGGLLLLIPSLACKQALLVGVTADDPINEWARRQCVSITNSDFVSVEDTSSLELLNASHLLVVGDTKENIALVALSLSLKQMQEEAWYLVPRSKPKFLDGISACNPDIAASIVSVSASYDCFHRSAEYMPPSLVSLIGPADGATVTFTSSSREPELELSFNLSAHAFSNEILKYFSDLMVRVTIDAHTHHFIRVFPDLHFSGESTKATVRGLEAGTHSFEACLLFGTEAEAFPLGAPSEPTLVEVVHVDSAKRAVPGEKHASPACHWSSVLAPVTAPQEMIARPVSTSGMPRNRPLSIALVELCFTPTPSLALERRHWVSAASMLPRDRFLFSYFAFGCDNSTGASSGQTLSVTLANAGVEVSYSHASPASTSLVGGESEHKLSRIKNSADVVVLLLSATTEVGSEVVSSSAQRLCNFITSDDDSGQAMVCLVEPIEQRSGVRRRDQPLLSDVPWSEAAPSVDAVLTTSFAAATSLRSTNSPVIEVTPGVAASLRSHFNANASASAGGGSECPTSQVVVWVGELEPSYSPGLMLRACAALVNDSTSNGRDTGRCVRCVFLGTGTLHRPLQVLSQRLGVADVVTFRQNEDGEGVGGYASVLSLLQGAGVLVSTRASLLPAPSSHAALWLDAAAMGLPLVATPPATRGVREWSDDVLCDGWNGLVAGSRSPEALREAIEKVFAPVVHFKGKEEQSVSSLPTLGAQMGERGSRLVRHRFEAHMSVTSLAEALTGSHRSARALRGFKKKKKTKRLLDGVATEDARSGSSVGGEEEEHGMVPGTPRFTGGVRMLRRQKQERHTSTVLGLGDVPCEGVVCRRLPSAPPRDLLSIRNVAIVHYRPPEQPLSSFEVGFREALALLNQLRRVNATMVNLHDLEAADSSEVSASACQYFEAFDAVWVKSNWEYVVDAFAREFIDCAVPRALLVSGSYPPPSVAALFAYDALAFEVFHYEEEHLWAHPLATHAFGIDTRVMAKAAPRMECSSVTSSACGNSEDTFEWDVLFIGAFADHFGHKRPTWIGTSEGFKGLRRAAIGKQNGPKAAQVVDELRAQGVAVLAPLPYHDLAKLIQRSRVVYVPDDVFGGGERAVLEARSLGVEVAIEDDNPKLKELLTSPVYDHVYYAQQLSRLQDMLEFSVRLALRE